MKRANADAIQIKGQQEEKGDNKECGCIGYRSQREGDYKESGCRRLYRSRARRVTNRTTIKKADARGYTDQGPGAAEGRQYRERIQRLHRSRAEQKGDYK